MRTERFLSAGALAVAALLAGCAVSPSAGPRYVERHEYYEPVRMAPPPPYIEHVGPPPVVGHVWISGYWNWGGSRYAWVPGRWDAPRAGHHWVPHRWEKNGDHWRQQGGRWERGGHTQTTTVVVRQPERSERRQAPAPEPRRFQREAPRGERSDDHRGRSADEMRPMPERSTPRPLPVEARGSPRVEPPRPVARSEERSAPERQRGAEAVVRGGNRDDARDGARERDRSGERNRDENRGGGRENTRDANRSRGA